MLSDYWQKVRMLNRNVWIIIGAGAAVNFVWLGVFAALFNLFLLRLGYGPQFVGLVTAIVALAYALAALPAGAIIRWLGVKRGMLIGLTGYAIGLVMLTQASSVPAAWRQPWILATYSFAFILLALFGVSSLPYLTGATSAEERPHAFALYWSLGPLGGFLGSLLGGLLPGGVASAMDTTLAQPQPYGYALALSTLIVIPALLGISTLREVRPQQAKAEAAQRGALPYVVLGVVGLVCFLRVAGEGGVRTFFNVYMDRALAVSTARLGAAMALANLLTIPAPLITPLLTQRLGRVRTVVAGVLSVAASMALLGFSPNWGVAAFAFTSMSVLAAAVRTVWTLVSQEAVSHEWRPLSAGISNVASGLAWSAMSVVGGYMVVGLGYRATFLTCAALVALGALSFWLYFRVPRGEQARPQSAPAPGSE